MPYNRPKFAACARWDENAVTFADSSIVGPIPLGIFVNTNDTVYATASTLNSVVIWPQGGPNLTSSFLTRLNYSFGVFVTTDGDIYADNGGAYHTVEKWGMSTSSSITAMNVNGLCGGIFVDIYDNLHCSLSYSHKVLKRFAGTDPNAAVIEAGNGTNGSSSNMLATPYGIFVDIDLGLYVADHFNNRIQLFPVGQLSGITLAGNGAPNTITLSLPTGVVLDGYGFLFIVDQANNRVVGSGPRGFRCVAGCTEMNGLGANQLQSPYNLAFDSHGNLLVTDAYNNRIQRFGLAKNVCGKLFDTLSIEKLWVQ